MRLISVRTVVIATVSAVAGIGTAVALVKVGTTPGASPGIEASPGVEASPGTLTGRVTDIATGIELKNALVLLEDAGIGAVTNPNGRFMLANVPAGRHTVTIQNLGYAEKQQEVTVVRGQTTIANSEITMVPLEVEGLIISVVRPERSSR
ncbi:MAG: carboxypeptidase regulatory-like domain-containing protein [Gemmatimonadetes bacterium]|nr:carboxypeptidase regulatory-like domain-containing protein [Gemmatimonadota bacterium]